uniref:ATP synthase F0 subunit 8 n=1 Tax=Oxytelus finitimus TaxID=3078932 RepID=UPI002A7ECCC2|nr:ATP synthase F0 subunit 8 [Oxytelus finitimus]WON66046.1 ATP synthase F0 subunit 8 [Oxytelus finitimus]
MPQMSPMNWLSLFFMFIMIYMMFNSLNYFNFTYSSNNNLYNKIKKNYNWKW